MLEQKLDYPKSENELRLLLDNLYQETKKGLEQGNKPCFKNLLEIASCDVVILTAIHKIKANKGSNTPGVDGETMREHFLESGYPQVMSRVKKCFENYKPLQIRRKHIPKQNSSETRPLGIPVIIDRIIQECIKMVIEPILEAQFFKHSYGFRPMRDAGMALERVKYITHKTGYHWIVEGDIKKFFDNVNHTILIKRLWSMGIRDRRILMIIKTMLKAGIMGENDTNELGTPQGGIISPILANVYLDAMDKWITREWECKKSQQTYSRHDSMIRAFKSTNLKPAYLVRYADDWVLITDSKENAIKWKHRIANYLEKNLKICLSLEKTKITNIKKKAISFLGFEFKMVRGKSKKGYISRVIPDRERLKHKIEYIRKRLKRIKKIGQKEWVIHEINTINSIIRGIIQYYESATWISVALQKYSQQLNMIAYKSLEKHGGKWIPANQVDNLISIHSNYTMSIPYLEFEGMKYGISHLAFNGYKEKKVKNPNETPYTEQGRKLYLTRTGKKPLKARADDLLNLHLSKGIATRKGDRKYNFEYFLNRAYAFNRDKGKCRVCSLPIINAVDVEIHHIEPHLSLEEVNRVNKLATTHEKCHHLIHDGKDHSELGNKIWAKIIGFREKLG